MIVLSLFKADKIFKKKFMIKHEAQFQILFNKYLRASDIIGAFELKQTSTNSIPFAALEKHQKESLLAIEKKGLVWKLSDSDPREKPCDCIATPRMAGWVVIKYPKCFVIISIGNFVFEEQRSKSKSLTKERAISISTRVIHT